VRAISYTVHGLIPASCVFADRYNREEVVRSLGKEINLNPPLVLGQLPDTPEELLKLDQVLSCLACVCHLRVRCGQGGGDS
jgi:RAP1 GTPase activating protein 1